MTRVGDIVTLATPAGPQRMRVLAVSHMTDGRVFLAARTLDDSWGAFLRADAFMTHEQSAVPERGD